MILLQLPHKIQDQKTPIPSTILKGGHFKRTGRRNSLGLWVSSSTLVCLKKKGLQIVQLAQVIIYEKLGSYEHKNNLNVDC